MRCSSLTNSVDRARPLLGTLVSIGCRGLPEGDAFHRIDTAFAVAAEIHALMSFHEATSDVSRLNREAAQRMVTVNPHTYAVLALAQDVAEASGGAFDVSVGGQLASWGRLPTPDAPAPDPDASWRDIELLSDWRVRFHRPLWIDLGGIAKGYAVDQACHAAAPAKGGRVIVNAGGDLRVKGAGAERIVLATGCSDEETIPAVEVENGSLASSTGRGFTRRHKGRTTGPHIDARRRSAVGGRSFVSVVAEDCAVADALTKVVLAGRQRAHRCLSHYGATAFYNDARGIWTTIGEVS